MDRSGRGVVPTAGLAWAHGLSITHLSAGCQGFEALSKASAAADRRAKTVWKMFAQMDTRTAPREAQRDCTTPRLIGFDIGLSPAASAPRMDPNTSACGSPPSAPLSMAHPLLQEQCSTGKILACADALGTGHAKPEKNHGEVRAQLRRARGGVRREHEAGEALKAILPYRPAVSCARLRLVNLV